MKRFGIILLLILTCLFAAGQNLEELGVKKGVKLNGGINLNTVGYYTNGSQSRRDPFNWFLTGNVNINFFGYNAPFSFSYSNVDKSFSQPFNQFSFSPQYKWIKTHIGYSSMTFSPYTLAGHVFLGGGVELTPGKWRIAAMYGRLRKAVPFDLYDSLQHTNASFKRMGYGLKVGYENEGDVVSANVFAAKDDVSSIPFIPPNSMLSPQENIAMGLLIRKKFLTRFFIEGEYAVSVLSKNSRVNSEEKDSTVFTPGENLIQGLLPENPTKRYYDAFNASAGYQGDWYTLRVKYERIAPEYQTLGAYYFNNDMRNITFMPQVKLLQSTLNIAANAGFQRNNLDRARTSETKRFVGSVNINYTPNEKWNYGLNYSNFSSYTNMRPQSDPFFQNRIDTLNFYQVSQTTNATVMRNFGSQKNPQSIMLNASYQKANDHASYEGGSQQSDFISANASYSYTIIPTNTTLGLSGNFYSTNAGGIESRYWGPTLMATKAMFKKTLRFAWVGSYNETSGGNTETSPIINNRFTFNFTPKVQKESGASTASHNLSLSLNILNRLKDVEGQPAFSELTGMFNYSYTF